MPTIDWSAPALGRRVTIDDAIPGVTVLHDFLTSRRDEIFARTALKIAARTTPRSTEKKLATTGLPLFFDHLIETLEPSRVPSVKTNDGAIKHGEGMLRAGFTVGQVVDDYANIWEAIVELAFESNVKIEPDEFCVLHRAIGRAVTEYVRLREQSIADAEIGRMRILAHALRNRLAAALLSFHNLRSGGAAIGGSTGAVLERSLKGLDELIDRALVAVRMRSDNPARETIWMGEFIEEMEAAAAIVATARNLHLTVGPVEYGIAIDADRHILAGAVANLLQNAFNFTRDRGSVGLFAHATADRVLIDIEDECGGLIFGQSDGLFRPAEQHGTGPTGLGLGLRISQRGVEANGGTIHVRNLPGKGCIFTVDLPRHPDSRSCVSMPAAQCGP
jgi:signal transduction histidine kinase